MTSNFAAALRGLPSILIAFCKEFDQLNIKDRFLFIICMGGSRKFGRGGPNLITFFFSWWGDRVSKYRYKWAIIGLPAKHH